MASEDDDEGTHLGQFIYDINGPAIQQFSVKVSFDLPWLSAEMLKLLCLVFRMCSAWYFVGLFWCLCVVLQYLLSACNL